MGLAETTAFGSSYYDSYDSSSGPRNSSSVFGVLSGMGSMLAGGFLSTTAITVLTSKVWEDASYSVPLITAIGNVVLLGSVYGGLSRSELSHKVIFTVSAALSCIPASPFLVGALPGLTVLIVSGCAACKQSEIDNGDVSTPV